jgi:GT2 family glycosyltransferase
LQPNWPVSSTVFLHARARGKAQLLSVTEPSTTPQWFARRCKPHVGVVGIRDRVLAIWVGCPAPTTRSGVDTASAASYYARVAQAWSPDAVSQQDTIAIVVLTHDRLHLLKKCYEDVLSGTSPATVEIVIWNNASGDGTREWLESLDDPRLRVVHSQENIGQNGYAEAVKLTTAPYIIEIDDDVTDAPPAWDAMLLDAFRRLPDIGFLAADLEDDPYDRASYIRHHSHDDAYVAVERNGVSLLEGPAGGGCAMTSRRVYDQVGGFPQQKGKVFYLEDAAYLRRVHEHGYTHAVLRDLRVHHTGGEYYGGVSRDKELYWERWSRRALRRYALKRAVFKVPLVRRLNRRYCWFLDPETPEAKKWVPLPPDDDAELPPFLAEPPRPRRTTA